MKEVISAVGHHTTVECQYKDTETDDQEVAISGRFNGKHLSLNYTRGCYRIHSDVVARLGRPSSNTKANQLVYSKAVRDAMGSRGWRNIDIVKYEPLVLLLCFTPTPQEVTVNACLQSRILRNTRRDSPSS